MKSDFLELLLFYILTCFHNLIFSHTIILVDGFCLLSLHFVPMALLMIWSPFCCKYSIKTKSFLSQKWTISNMKFEIKFHFHLNFEFNWNPNFWIENVSSMKYSWMRFFRKRKSIFYTFWLSLKNSIPLSPVLPRNIWSGIKIFLLCALWIIWNSSWKKLNFDNVGKILCEVHMKFNPSSWWRCLDDWSSRCHLRWKLETFQL